VRDPWRRYQQEVIFEALPSAPYTNSLLIPFRVRRPSATRKALGFGPLVQARWAHPARVEGVPLAAADTKPFVLLSW